MSLLFKTGKEEKQMFSIFTTLFTIAHLTNTTFAVCTFSYIYKCGGEGAVGFG